VVAALKEALSRDRSKTNVLSMSALGLVEMTRKRVRESLGESLNESCFYCDGVGVLKEATTVCYEVLRTLERELRGSQAREVSLRVNPRVADVLLMEERYALEELEQLLALTIHVLPDRELHREHFEITALP
jgi:ribonuclease G